MTPFELADKMARHIIGEGLCPEGECCKKCIAIASEAIAAAYEDAAKIAEADFNTRARQRIAAAIRAKAG